MNRFVVPLKKALRRLADSVYRSSEMVWLRLELAQLRPRYTLRRNALQVVILDDSNALGFAEFRRRYPHGSARILDDVRRPGFTCFMARAGEGIGGIMLLGTAGYHYQEPKLRVRVNPGEVCVYGIWILPEHRRKMVAAILVEAALLEFKNRGYPVATGFTNRTNKASLAVTEGFGFEERNRVRFRTILGYQLQPNRESSCAP